jgi:hypothetical protein
MNLLWVDSLKTKALIKKSRKLGVVFVLIDSVNFSGYIFKFIIQPYESWLIRKHVNLKMNLLWVDSFYRRHC